ncbi:MAG: DUF1565 domain-containing protein [Phycisphaerae bacterium]|nr:DUF1565 domain-containing protein [Phycisphaerae bacterium]
MIYSGTVVVAAFLAIVFLGACQSTGRGYFVDPAGDDTGPGSARQPFRTIQRALDGAGAGDHIVVTPGVYRERVRFVAGGTPEAPLVLEGQPGAVIDGSIDWTPQWVEAPDLAPGAYRAGIPFQPFNLTADAKFVPGLSESKDGAAEVFVKGVKGGKKTKPDAELVHIGGLWMYRSDQGELLIRFAGGRNPSAVSIAVAPQEAAVAIRGVDHCVVRGLVLQNAFWGVHTADTEGSIVEYCSITGTTHGVWMADKTRNSVVRRCDITLNPCFPTAGGKNAYIWNVFKDYGYSDHRGIELRNAGNGNEICYNYVHETHDGIETKSDQRDPNLMQNTNVHHNLIVDVLDDSLEPNAGGVNCRWHHNWLRKEGTGMRIKFPVAGPLYVYRNVFDGANAWSFHDSKATVYFYHNTMHTRRPLHWNRSYHTEGFWFLNNIFLGTRQYEPVDPARDQPFTGNMAPDHIDYNLYTSSSPSEPPKTGYELHGVGVAGPDQGGIDLRTYHLHKDSPAIDAGADLSSKFDRALPGCEPGYFAGAAPDIGAYEAGREDQNTIGVDPKDTGAFARARMSR